MKKFMKTTGIVLTCIIALMVILPFAFKGKIKELVIEEGNKMLNAEFGFEDLDISLFREFPKASIGLEGFWLKGKDVFEHDTLVKAGDLQVAVDLMSLFGDSGFDISKVLLSDTYLKAIVLEDGHPNWDIMKSDTTPVEEETAPADVPAPDFTVVDKDGNPVKLSDFIGKPIVLNFWASWCGPCKMEMPDFDEKAAELEGKVQFLMVNLTDGAQETVETASAFIESQGYTFPVFYDTDQSAAYAYGVYSIPTTYFIDAEGYGIAYASGAISGDLLQSGIDMILE